MQVLEQSLALIKKRWKKERCSYAYACSQLKSIRQDLTVQVGVGSKCCCCLACYGLRAVVCRGSARARTVDCVRPCAKLRHAVVTALCSADQLRARALPFLLPEVSLVLLPPPPRLLLLLVLLCCVQGVATQLTRDAYETHARIALEAADLAEFRQCLARLKQLYRAGVSDAALTCAGTAAAAVAPVLPQQLLACGISAECVRSLWDWRPAYTAASVVLQLFSCTGSLAVMRVYVAAPATNTHAPACACPSALSAGRRQQQGRVPRVRPAACCVPGQGPAGAGAVPAAARYPG